MTTRTRELRKRLAAVDPERLERLLVLTEPPVPNVELHDPHSAYRQVLPFLAGRTTEALVAVFTNRRCKIITTEVMTMGTEQCTIVDARGVFRRALLLNASGVLVAHNHPSGDVRPSDADRSVTRALIEAGRLLGISVLDHLVVTDQSFTSIRAEGSVSFEAGLARFTA